MALGAALVDQARIIEKVAAGPKVEGRTSYTPTAGAWFKARLTIPTGEERSDSQSGQRRRQVKRPTLMFKAKYPDGTAILLEGDQKVEVNSAELGTAVWRVQGPPEPIRKRRLLIGWLATLERTGESVRKEA